MTGIFRFGAKLSIVGGVVYLSNQYGIWGDSKRTEEIYKEVYSLVVPYLKDIPVELPELPKASEITSSTRQCWNCGVVASTRFLANLPHNTYTLAERGVDFINEKFREDTKTSEGDKQ